MIDRVKRRQEEEIIHSVIFAFEGQVLSDIVQNAERQEVVAFLTAGLLEQFSGFFFSGFVEIRIETFVKVYLPRYSGTGLYDILKKALAYKVVDKLKEVVEMDDADRKHPNAYYPQSRMVIDAFLRDLKAGMKIAVDDLRNDEAKRKQAILWFRDHPVRLLPSHSWYSDEDVRTLSAYYRPLISDHKLFARSTTSFGMNYWQGGYQIYVLMEQFGDYENVRIPLDIFIGLMDLKTPAEVLGW